MLLAQDKVSEQHQEEKIAYVWLKAKLKDVRWIKRVCLP